MIIPRRVQNAEALATLFQGTLLASGNTGTTGLGSADFQDLTDDAFADVSVGDRIYISGESTSTVFLVADKTDDNNITLDNNATVDRDANAVWRACKNNAISPDDMLSPIIPIDGGSFLVLYDATTFHNP